MKHRHLTGEHFTTAAIDDILARGRLPDWAPLITVIRADPFGEVAEKARMLCEKPLYAAPVFRRVIAAARAVGRRPSLMGDTSAKAISSRSHRK
jgi:hypothetical protein